MYIYLQCTLCKTFNKFSTSVITKVLYCPFCGLELTKLYEATQECALIKTVQIMHVILDATYLILKYQYLRIDPAFKNT